MTSGFPRTGDDPTARFILDLARSLTRAGYTITVLAPLDAGAAREEDRDGVKVYRFLYFYPETSMNLAYGEGMLYNIRRSPRAALQVPFFFFSEFLHGLKIAGKENVSVIHAHWLVPQGLVAVGIRCFVPARVIVTVHGSDLRILPGWLSRAILRRMDAIISPHPEITGIVHSLGFAAKEIPNLIDESLFSPEISSSGIREELAIETTRVITFVARLNEFKDPITFVKSIPLVIEREPDVTFVIAGDGPLLGEVRSLEQKLGIQKNVRILGNRQDINRILKISSVFVALSPYENIWSLVIIEAMKMGVPCIVTRAGTTEKYLRHNTDAILVPPRDEKTLAREIVRLLHDEALRTSLGGKGRDLMESKFSADSIVRSYDRMISGLFPDDEKMS